jgi:hypothetical protein
VVLPERQVVERSTTQTDPAVLTSALVGVLEPPYRALCLRRSELWVIGAVALDVVEIADVPGEEIEVVRDEKGVRIRIDGLPSLERIPELERRGARRGTAYVVRARRLAEAAFELEVEML